MATKDQQAKDIFEQATESFKETMKMGVDFQQEATKWWTEMWDKTGTAGEWPQRVKAMADEAVPLAQRNVEESLHLIEQNFHSNVELLKKGFEVAQSGTPTEAQGRLQEMWETTLASLRANTQAVVATNTRTMETWTNWVQHNVTDTNSKSK